MAAGNVGEGVNIIGGGGDIAFSNAALEAVVDDGVNIFFLFYPDWFHEAAAGSGAVAGMNVHVAAKEATGAMIGKAVAVDKNAAMAAMERFHTFLKTPIPY